MEKLQKKLLGYIGDENKLFFNVSYEPLVYGMWKKFSITCRFKNASRSPYQKQGIFMWYL